MKATFKAAPLLLAALALGLAPACSSTSSTQRSPSVGVIYKDSQITPVTVISRSEEKAAVGDGSRSSYILGSLGSVAGSLGGGIVGSIFGGLAGSELGRKGRMKTVSRYTVALADGSTVSLYQDDRDAPPAAGTSAYLLRDETRGVVELHRNRPAT